MRFVNDDVRIVSKSIMAKGIGIDDLLSLVVLTANNALKRSKRKNLTQSHFGLDFDLAEDCVQEILRSDRSIKSDNVYHLIPKNIASNIVYEKIARRRDVGNPILGFQTLANGFSFVGFINCDHWCNEFSILYYDGSEIRMYTPICGNCVNADYKMTFGGEGAYHHVDESALLEKYRKCDFWNEDHEWKWKLHTTDYKRMTDEQWQADTIWRKENYEDWCWYASNVYLSQYGLTRETVGLNWNAIRNELMDVFAMPN